MHTHSVSQTRLCACLLFRPACWCDETPRLITQGQRYRRVVFDLTQPRRAETGGLVQTEEWGQWGVLCAWLQTGWGPCDLLAGHLWPMTLTQQALTQGSVLSPITQWDERGSCVRWEDWTFFPLDSKNVAQNSTSRRRLVVKPASGHPQARCNKKQPCHASIIWLRLCSFPQHKNENLSERTWYIMWLCHFKSFVQHAALNNCPHQQQEPTVRFSINSCKLTVCRREGGHPGWVKFVAKHAHHQFPSRHLGQPSVNLPISLQEWQQDRAAYTHRGERAVMILYAPEDSSFGCDSAAPTGINAQIRKRHRDCVCACLSKFF